jgi:hypothetical protein
MSEDRIARGTLIAASPDRARSLVATPGFTAVTTRAER